jgi:hypothetical protein
MSSAAINKKHFDFISAPATKRVECFQKKALNCGGKLARLANRPRRMSNGECRRALDLVTAIKKAAPYRGFELLAMQGWTHDLRAALLIFV